MRRGYLVRKLLDYFGVIVLLSILFFLWMLYHGPLSIPFLKPYIIEALNSEQSEYTMDIGEVNLELVRSIQPLKIIAKNVQFRKNDDNISIKAPKLFLSFSMRALLKGLIAPSSVYIKNPTVAIFTTYGVEKNKQDDVNIKKVQYYTEWFSNFLEHYNSPDKIYPESYINNIYITNASIEFHEVDLGRKWLFSDMNLSFHRRMANLELAAGGVVDFGDRMSTLQASAQFNPLKEKLALNISFNDIIASDFIKNIGDISNINVPLEGRIGAEINFAEFIKKPDLLIQNIDNAIEKIDFNIKGSQGTVAFGSNTRFIYPIDSFSFDGQITGGLDIIALKNSELTMKNQKALIDFKATGYKNYFLHKSLKDLKLSLSAHVDSLSMNDLSRFWPRYFSEPAWEWCKESLYGGAYQNASFNFDWAFNQQTNSFDLTTLKGKALIKNGTIYYLSEMPIVTNVDGTAIFGKGVIDIKLDKGRSDGLTLNNGHVRLYDLNKDKNYIDIQINADSSIKDALEYIGHPPLEFGAEFGIKPENFTGNARIDLGLAFELYQDLKPEEIQVNVKADLSNVVAKNVFQNQNLKMPKASLSVKSGFYQFSGDIFYDDIPIEFDLKQNLYKPHALSGTLQLQATPYVLEKFNIDHTLLKTPYLDGFAQISAKFSTDDNKPLNLDINANLENTSVNYAFLGFNKQLHEQGAVEASLVFKNKKLADLPHFILTKPDFTISGSAGMNKQGNIQQINIKKIEGPKTSASAKIDFVYKPQYLIKLNVSGSNYDLTELFAKQQNQPKQLYPKIENNADDDLKSLPNAEIFIAVSSLWTNPDTPVKNFAGSAVLKNGVGIEEAHIVGNYGTDKSVKFVLDYAPKVNGEYYLNIDSNNAGSTLRVLRLYDNMNGGILKIEAKKDANQNIIGHAKIRDFKIHNTPILTKLLTVASFSGMLDLLKGDGLVFSHFDAPFTYKNKILTINEAKMFGNVLGLTADGTINRRTSAIDIQGIISPAYGLNSLMGRIPLVGKIITGKDGTVFAVDYDISDTIENPKININPLSILSPNAVKDLFREEK